MTRQLNRWIDSQSYRVEAQWVSALDRRRASDRLMRAWRQMLTAETPEGASHARVIDFSDLCVGDLPQLPVVLEHITSIDLSGVRLTAHGSNDFLRSLPQLRTLRINNNALVELPGAVEGLDNLTRLEAAHNRLVNTEMLQSQLRSLAHLEWLDLSTNALESFNAGELPALRTLNLSGNALTRWPGGVMNLSELSELDLSNNRIHHIPDQLYDRTYNNLMAGTDVTDNPLEYDDLEALYDYQHSTGNGLGFTAEELESGLHHSDDSASDSEPEADEDLDAGIHESPSVQKARWFNEVPADSPKHRIWDVVSGRQGSDGLFHLLTELKNTRDFIEGKALLTARVWDVLEAAYNNEALGSELFVQARSPYTCGDGRILLFSDLEVKVHEFNVLKGVTSSEAGSVLLGLYKSLYRLERVEEIAREFMVQYPTIDPAEVRLDFRISLAERLQLPKQPKDMIYRNLVEHPSVELDEPFNVTLQKAYERVIATDNSPEFSHYLLSSEKWISYLKAQYPDECQALELQLKTEADQLEDRYPVINESYNGAIKALGSKKKREFETLYERLSHLERAKLNGQ
ncbi:NEL-type E3 ubiquitin ligase domain-containing protein [Pseudomonas lundensis]